MKSEMTWWVLSPISPAKYTVSGEFIESIEVVVQVNLDVTGYKKRFLGRIGGEWVELGMELLPEKLLGWTKYGRVMPTREIKAACERAGLPAWWGVNER